MEINSRKYTLANEKKKGQKILYIMLLLSDLDEINFRDSKIKISRGFNFRQEVLTFFQQKSRNILFPVNVTLSIKSNLSQAAYKERRLPERNTLLVALVGCSLGLLILACILCPKSKSADEEEKKSANKRKSKKKN